MCSQTSSCNRAVQSVSSDGSSGGWGSSQIKHRGVRKRKWGKWVSEVRLPNSRDRIWLGSYDSSEKAARAFDAAAFCLRGRKARLNFPNNPPQILPGGSMTHQQIQEAAARHAHLVPTTKVVTTPMTIKSPTISTSEISEEVMAAAMTLTMTSPSMSPLEMSEEVMDGSFLNLLTKGLPGMGDFGLNFANPVGFGDMEEGEYGFMMNSNLWNF